MRGTTRRRKKRSDREYTLLALKLAAMATALAATCLGSRFLGFLP